MVRFTTSDAKRVTDGTKNALDRLEPAIYMLSELAGRFDNVMKETLAALKEVKAKVSDLYHWFDMTEM